MLSDVFKEEIVNEIGRLDYGNQRRVLDFVKALSAVGTKGVPGKRLLSFVGVTSEAIHAALIYAADAVADEQFIYLKTGTSN